MTNHEYMTVPDVARQLNVTRAFIYKLAKRGHLAHIRVGQVVRIKKEAAEKLFTEGLPIPKKPYKRRPR